LKNQASAILLFVVFLKKTEIEYLCQNDFMKKILWQNQDQNLKEYELCFQKMHIIKTFHSKKIISFLERQMSLEKRHQSI